MMHQSRIRRLRAEAKVRGLDSVLVSSHADIYYYTGLRLSGDDAGFLLVGRKSRPVFFASPLNNEAAGMEAAEVVFIRTFEDVGKHLGGGSVGFDEYHTSCHLFSRMRKLGVKWRRAAEAIKSPRAIKDGHEVGQMRRGLKINRSVLDGLDIVGKTERQVSREIFCGFAERGATAAFETIVASGRNSSFIHYTPRERRIRSRDLVVIDFGAKVGGYCTDMTRTFCSRPGRKERGLIDDVKGMQSAIIGEAHAGAAFSGLQSAWERMMMEKGYKVMHGVGHGIGLEVHEGSRSEVLKAGMVITVEPGVYLPGFGGCRIEDMILIKKGRSRIL
ncbi:MAG: aminopeptidase P family protein [Candidatus Aenigmarchaeota archaeon]|nr:aminopeptidase P family protein [Candidatus Aenigmarchaeota archaeon]